MKQTIKISLVLMCLLILGIACSDDETSIDPTIEINIKKKEFVENYVNIVSASYEDSATKLNELQIAVDAFVASPDESSFTTEIGRAHV
jgi:putative iron-regulated protein